MYKDVSGAVYTASTDGETVATFTQLQGSQLILVVKEIKQLMPNEFTFNTTTGTLTLTGGQSLAKGESLFVLSKLTVN